MNNQNQNKFEKEIYKVDNMEIEEMDHIKERKESKEIFDNFIYENFEDKFSYDEIDKLFNECYDKYDEGIYVFLPFEDYIDIFFDEKEL